jgi:superoxide dismutase, Fe-Mn family
MKRRNFIKNSLVASAGVSLVGAETLSACSTSKKLYNGTEFSLPKLPYAYDALEPYIDKLTMEIHHTKHHQAYITNLNKALAGKENVSTDITKLCQMIATFNSDTIRNNAGGHWNHTFFWDSMKPAPATRPSGNLEVAINTAFGSFEKMKESFTDIATKRFGSGWAWLVLDEKGKLQINSTPNQDNPLMDVATFRGKPLLGLDVWEHAYYLKYQNKRKDYIDAWWNLVNWDTVANRL